ncbi:thioredoxin family protein [Terribacillus saccharophilus]|uniref:thioredoxin family protein n=1 Tax=Terribacillus saccharophilus TaxID=361277 RepID=UPI0039829E06
MRLRNIDEVEKFISTAQHSILFISSPGCSVCQALLPRIKDMLARYPDVKLGLVDASEVQEVAGRFLAFEAPTILVLMEGKEQFREGRFIRMEEFEEKLKKISSPDNY